MQTIRTKQVLNYVFMPGIVPRLKEFFGTGTGGLAYLIATVFQTARLLPPNHPYLNSANIRKYGIRDVFAAAGNNLVFDRKHLDQILIFFTLMLGFILLFLQFGMLIVGLIISQAHALSPVGMFTTPDSTHDIAFELLDRVFGIPGVFDSCVAQGVSCSLNASLNNASSAAAFPTQFNTALHGLFEYYSMGLLVVGLIIFLYYIVVVVAETAQTGTPFGKRFSHIWVPIRLVVAIGLLIPINYGLNTGQYIVLYAAKMGSGFATNGWNLYNSTLDNALGAEDTSLYARPNPPDVWPLVKFMLVVKTCAVAYDLEGVKEIKPYLVKSPGQSVEVTPTYEYKSALEFYNKGDVVIRFGKKASDSKKFVGGIEPHCGEILIPTQTALDTGSLAGPFQVQEDFFNLISYLWGATETSNFAEVSNHLTDSRSPCSDSNMDDFYGGISCTEGISTAYISQFRSTEQGTFNSLVDQARQAMISAQGMNMTEELLSHGWGGAGIWYNKIAEVNGAFFGAVNFVPTPTLMPIPVNAVLESRRATDQSVNTKNFGAQNQSNDQAIKLADPIQQHVATAIYEGYKRIGPDTNYQSNDMVNKGNIFKDAINLLFGTTGLFTMRENSDVHPLAQLVGLGKGIMDATVRNLFTATLFSAGGGFMSAFPDGAGAGLFTMLATIFSTVATISLTIGFTLYYVLPFLPFMYFFFAVGGWVKSIFEAMVGVPLWALGHLRIDGHGLPGEGALEGYYMIFEIFLRPILIVFGLIGGMVTFTAMAKVLNEIFTIVTANLTGFDNSGCVSTVNCGSVLPPAVLEVKRDVIDQFFFTVLYTVIIYMMATSSFKMIDQIPSRIMRWLGTNASGFADHNDAEGVMNAYLVGGAMNMTSSLTGAVNQSAAGAGRTLGAALNPPKAPEAPPAGPPPTPPTAKP